MSETHTYDGYVYYGWDEVGLFDHEFTHPVYALTTEG